MLSVANILSSRMNFEESEEDLAFRIRFLNSVMLIAIFCAVIFIALDQLTVNLIGDVQLYSTIALASISLIGMLYLRGRKHAYRICALGVLVAAYVAFTTALVYVPDDEFRIIWYYVLIVCAYVLLGNTLGVTATIATVVAIVMAKFGLGVLISSHALFTFLLSISVTSGITFAYTSLSNTYFQRMTSNFQLLRELASKDPLTGLWNARAFYEMANKTIQISQRNATPYCAMFIDLDHFKAINDQFGHEAGDAVLKAIAECIAKSSRDSDIVGRIGGEEFVVFLPNTNIQGALLLAEKIRSNAEKLQMELNAAVTRSVTLSIGVARNFKADLTIADIQKRADSAMYEAKRQGRNRVAFDTAMLE